MYVYMYMFIHVVHGYLIQQPVLYILQTSDGRRRESRGTTMGHSEYHHHRGYTYTYTCTCNTISQPCMISGPLNNIAGVYTCIHVYYINGGPQVLCQPSALRTFLGSTLTKMSHIPYTSKCTTCHDLPHV